MNARTISILVAIIALPTVAHAQDLPEFSQVSTDDVVEETADTETTDASDATDRGSTADDAAADASPDAPEEPSVFHRPEMLVSGGHDTRFRATVFADWEFERVYLAYRPVGGEEFTEVNFERADEDGFVAVLPGEDVQPPGLEYYIGSESKRGPKTHYASAEDPHRVVILNETEKTREAARLARHDGNRSEFELDGEFTNWGRHARDDEKVTVPFSDRMWSSTLHYRYRFLSSLYEIAFGLGVIRGSQAMVTLDSGDEIAAHRSDALEPDENPGMNYGYGQVTWELHRNFSMDARLLLGASTTGFAAGAGAVARIGRLGGTRLEFGGELFEDIGNLGFMSFHWDTLPRIPMGLTVEVTNRPNPAGRAGTRLLYDVGYDFSDAFGLSARVGVPVRSGAVEQGFTSGLSARYAF